MGLMKDFLITVHNGGDEAVAAVQRVSEDWRAQLEQAADEIDRLRLTEAEREAVEWALKEAVWSYNPDCGEHPATMRGLLERLK